MKPKRKKKHIYFPPSAQACAIVLFFFLGAASCSCAWMAHSIGALSYPPSDMLAQRYLDAVLRQDLEAIKASVGDCPPLIAQARTDMDRLNKTEVRNVKTLVEPNSGSSDTLEFVTLTFEFRKRGEPDWRAANLFFSSDYTPPGLRRLCYFF
jgi:hypothetical protein